MKLALGTVQFGMQYGVANKEGQISFSEAQRILSTAQGLGIDTLDTAAAYGNSEEVLGRIGVAGFNIISKLPPKGTQALSETNRVMSCVTQSLKKLKQKSIYGLLLHRPLELLSTDGEKIFKTLKDLKKQGVLKKIGISIYGPEDLDKLAPHYLFDIVQAPMNILDRRMMTSGWLKRLKQQGTEVHIRSAFLQGLLLMPPQERPAYFQPWNKLFETFDQWARSEALSPLEACLGFLNQQSEVDKIVVGVVSADQLSDIGRANSAKAFQAPESLQSQEPTLINPGRWTL